VRAQEHENMPAMPPICNVAPNATITCSADLADNCTCGGHGGAKVCGGANFVPGTCSNEGAYYFHEPGKCEHVTTEEYTQQATFQDACSKVKGCVLQSCTGQALELSAGCVCAKAGCMNQRAANYDPKAMYDDNSCNFVRTHAGSCEEVSPFTWAMGAVCKRLGPVNASTGEWFEMHYGYNARSDLITICAFTRKEAGYLGWVAVGTGNGTMASSKVVIGSGGDIDANPKIDQTVTLHDSSHMGGNLQDSPVKGNLSDFVDDISNVLIPDGRCLCFHMQASKMEGSLKNATFIYALGSGPKLQKHVLKGAMTLDFARELKLHCDLYTCSAEGMRLRTNATVVACEDSNGRAGCTDSICCEKEKIEAEEEEEEVVADYTSKASYSAVIFLLIPVMFV